MKKIILACLILLGIYSNLFSQQKLHSVHDVYMFSVKYYSQNYFENNKPVIEMQNYFDIPDTLSYILVNQSKIRKLVQKKPILIHKIYSLEFTGALFVVSITSFSFYKARGQVHISNSGSCNFYFKFSDDKFEFVRAESVNY
jgi:hypothetical protein